MPKLGNSSPIIHSLSFILYRFFTQVVGLNCERSPILSSSYLYAQVQAIGNFGLHSLDSKALYRVDFSSEPAFVQKPYATLYLFVIKGSLDRIQLCNHNLSSLSKNQSVFTAMSLSDLPKEILLDIVVPR